MGQVLGSKGNGIEHLDLAANAIGPNGVSSMVSYLIANQRLKSLDISRTDMQDRGCIALANALEANRCILGFWALWFGHKGMHGRGCISLTNALDAKSDRECTPRAAVPSRLMRDIEQSQGCPWCPREGAVSLAGGCRLGGMH